MPSLLATKTACCCSCYQVSLPESELAKKGLLLHNRLGCCI